MITLDAMNAKLDAVLQSQGKLLAALNERNESLTDLRTDLKAIHIKLDALEKRWDEADKLMPCVLERRKLEFTALSGKLDALGNQFGELLELLSLKATRTKRKGKKR